MLLTYVILPLVVKFPWTVKSPVIVPPANGNFVLAAANALLVLILTALAKAKAPFAYDDALVILVFCCVSTP